MKCKRCGSDGSDAQQCSLEGDCGPWDESSIDYTPGMAVPPTLGETYFCFTPDQLEAEVRKWCPFDDEGKNQVMRNAVIAFAYSREVAESKIRKEMKVKQWKS